MACNLGGVPTRSYEEIEPFCRWKRGEESDILEVHLPPGSKKEHLKIQVNSLGILAITGECPVDQTKWIRFRKETKVSKRCRRNEIRGKFSRGILYVTMPKAKPLFGLEGLIRNNSKTLTPKPKDTSKPDEETPVPKGVSEFYSRFSSLRRIFWRNTVAEGMAAAFVVVVAVAGAFMAYQYILASDSHAEMLH